MSNSNSNNGFFTSNARSLNNRSYDSNNNNRGRSVSNNNNNGDVCPICLDPLTTNTVYSTSCNHKFHERCIREYYHRGGDVRCPICRRPNTGRFRLLGNPAPRSRNRTQRYIRDRNGRTIVPQRETPPRNVTTRRWRNVRPPRNMRNRIPSRQDSNFRNLHENFRNFEHDLFYLHWGPQAGIPTELYLTDNEAAMIQNRIDDFKIRYNQFPIQNLSFSDRQNYEGDVRAINRHIRRLNHNRTYVYQEPPQRR